MVQLEGKKALMLDHFKNVQVFYNLMPFIECLFVTKTAGKCAAYRLKDM